MAATHQKSEAILRGARMLRTALGPAIARFLEDPAIVEVMLNPDGRLWIDRLSTGLVETQERLAAAEGERIVRLVAHHVGAEVHPASPRVSAELPETGERFEGLLPPVVAAPTFAIRKPAVAVFTLDDYAAAGIMTMGEADALRQAVTDRRNILVAGGKAGKFELKDMARYLPSLDPEFAPAHAHSMNILTDVAAGQALAGTAELEFLPSEHEELADLGITRIGRGYLVSIAMTLTGGKTIPAKPL